MKRLVQNKEHYYCRSIPSRRNTNLFERRSKTTENHVFGLYRPYGPMGGRESCFDEVTPGVKTKNIIIFFDPGRRNTRRFEQSSKNIENHVFGLFWPYGPMGGRKR